MIGGVLTEEQKAAMLARIAAANEKIQEIKPPTDEELDELLKRDKNFIGPVKELLGPDYYLKNKFNPKEFGNSGNKGGKRKSRKNKKRKTRKDKKSRKSRK
jgi:hypothetical protein